MSFKNLEYLYNNLPSRFRRDDKELFLKRFLQVFGETLDGWDDQFDVFFENIRPATAEVKWIEFWLESLFGWSWFPWWFLESDKRRLYGNFARHLGRRGTRRGIELFLRDFGIIARVHTRTIPWGEFVWGETNFISAEPLHVLVEILGIESRHRDLHVWGESGYGEFYYVEPRALFTLREIIDLIRYVQPHAQEIFVSWRNLAKQETTSVYEWEVIEW